jgi:hypothetical protein
MNIGKEMKKLTGSTAYLFLKWNYWMQDEINLIWKYLLPAFR